jgi:uridine kinase
LFSVGMFTTTARVLLLTCEFTMFVVSQSQRRGARFITKDYKSREEGSMTKMLRDLDLPLLQTRRQHQRLIFLYKVVEGQIPAISPHEYISLNLLDSVSVSVFIRRSIPTGL